jgi:ParB/RepB/Spo0J family partition protein
MKPEKLGWFKFDPNQPRKNCTEEDLLGLGASLKAHGQIQPVVARPDGTILCGERRVRAAQLVGLSELTVIISDRKLTDTEVRLMQLAENIHRTDLSGWERYVAYYEILTLNPGWQQKDLADHLKLNEGTVSRALSVAKCSKEWQDALKAGQVTLTQCAKASQMRADEQEGYLASILSGAPKEEQDKKARNKSEAASVKTNKKIKCPLQSGVVIQAAGDELSLDDFIEALAEAQKLAKAALSKGMTASTACKVWADMAAV